MTSSGTRRALLIMAKKPEPGTTKTRLLPVLSALEAAELSETFLLDTVETTRLVRSMVDGLVVRIAGSPAGSIDYFGSVAADLGFEQQLGETLSERLDHVIATTLASGFDHVIAINADSPSLPASYIAAGFAALDDDAVDVVFGPAEDGGYYLIGVKSHHQDLVRTVEMSTTHVLADSLVIAETLRLQTSLLPLWFDVDEPADLERLQSDIQAGQPCGGHTVRFLEKHRLAIEHVRASSRVVVVIPALNEAGNIGVVVAQMLAEGVHTVIVVDNGSTDATASEARTAGAVVVTEPRRGYGQACATGSAIAQERGADVIVFIDGDQSSRPDEVGRLVDPIIAGQADLVLGSRVLGTIAPGSMPPHQRFGNWLSAALMNLLYDSNITDLGPYRAIRAQLLVELDMQEMTFGWPTEMMVKCARRKAVLHEVPVTWQRRAAGVSKVGGTLRGSILAARHILGVTLRHSRWGDRAVGHQRRLTARRRRLGGDPGRRDPGS